MKPAPTKNVGENVVRIEAEALRALADRISGPMAASFAGAIDLLLHCRGRVVVTGMGKSGIVARKIAATLSSTGTPALYLASAAEVALDCSIAKEACSLGLAPTASTTTMLALGDALAVTISEQRGFKEEDFADLHPGGKLGKQLARVDTLMHSGEALPQVTPGTKMPDVIYEMSRKKLGVAAVVDQGKLVGIVSDGDLRRLLEHRGKDALDLTASESMTCDPKTIGPQEFAATALAIMEEKKITSLAVVGPGRRLLGIVHLHDLWGTEMV
jgi:arabinose-5-phosphate isomerase